MTMERELVELKSFGVFGIYREAFNIISSSKKIFFQITLALFLPLIFFSFAQKHIAIFLFGEFLDQQSAIEKPEWSSTDDVRNWAIEKPERSSTDDVRNWASSHVTSEWALFLLFKASYFLVGMVLHVLSTSAVVYAAACIYTGKPITFRKVMSVAPKTLKSVTTTYLWSLFVFLSYNLASIVFLFGCVLFGLMFIGKQDQFEILTYIGLTTLMIVYLIGLLYIALSWQLALVVSILEGAYGVKALTKTFSLIKGKVLCMSMIFVILLVFDKAIKGGWNKVMVYGKFEGVFEGVMTGTVYIPLLMVVNLVKIVLQTVIYFVCKSYHQENIDKSRLVDHLEVDMDDYVFLHNKEQFLISV